MTGPLRFLAVTLGVSFAATMLLSGIGQGSAWTVVAGGLGIAIGLAAAVLVDRRWPSSRQ